MSKIMEELRCHECGKKLSRKQPLFDTAWSGLYWCGSPECAYEIMAENCAEFDADDPINHD